MREKRALSFFAGISAALIIVATIVLRTYFRTVNQHDAMLVSAGLAFAVQLGSYALLRPGRPGRGVPGELLIRWAIRCCSNMIAEAKDFITPHITDSHTLDYPCFTSAGHWYQRLIPQACEYELPRWNPIHIGRFALDISPTRHVVMLWIAASLCIVTTLLALRAHNRKTREGKAPSGFGNGLEALVLYLRNEIVLPNVGAHGNGYVPYLLTLFFFILFANLLGLVPYGATSTR